MTAGLPEKYRSSPTLSCRRSSASSWHRLFSDLHCELNRFNITKRLGMEMTTGRTKLFGVCTALIVTMSTNALAAAIDDLSAGYWYEVPNSAMSQVDPCPSSNCSYSANLGQSAAIDAWNGGALDTRRDRLLVWGGGHSGYAGNEIYAFDVNTEQWIMLSNPSTSVQESVSHYSDGRPSSRHTYNDIQYDAATDSLISLNAGATYSPTADSFPTVDAFNMSTGEWSRFANRPSSGGTPYGAWSAVHPTTGNLYHHTPNGGRLQMFDPSTNQWSTHVESGGVPIYMTAAIDPGRNTLVATGGGLLYVYDLNNPNAAPLKGVSSGDKTAENDVQIGFSFDPVSDQFVAWVGGTQVYTLDPDTWVWSRVDAAAGNTVTPSAPNANGTYGRFRYIPSKNAFIVVNRTTDNVYYYKLTDGGGDTTDPAPTVSLSANPATVDAGSSSTLSWSSTNATSCTASGAWSGSRAVSGSESTGALDATSTYTLTCDGAGGSAGQSVSVTVSSSSGEVDPDEDWQSRAGGVGVVMATRFDTESEVTNWIAGSNGDHVTWDQGLKASGNGSLRFAILSSDSASSGNWARWLADDQREFLPGDEFFVQFRQYVPGYYATHPFSGGGGWKQAIISRHASIMNGVSQPQPYGSNQLNEIVIQNTNHRGIVQGYNRDSAGKYPPWEVSASTACSGTDFIYQNAVDLGPQNVGTACENDRARYGGLYSYYQQRPDGFQAGSPDPLSPGFRYYPDEWLTFLVHVRLGQYGGSSFDTMVKLYAAREGRPYRLLIDRSNLDLGDGPGHDALWLLPYNTGRQSDPNRQDTFTNYDEVIVSTDFIPAPDAGPSVQPAAPANLVVE